MVYKKSGEVLSKLKSRGFRATSLSTYDFSTLYTTLPHNLIKEKVVDLIERAFKNFYKNEGTLYLACNDGKAFSLLQTIKDIHFGLVRMYVTYYRIFWIIFTFGNKLYRQIVCTPPGTNCAPFVADLFLFCYERDFMTSLSHDTQANIIETFNSTSRYLDNLLNIDKP